MKKVSYVLLCTVLLVTFMSLGAVAADTRSSERAVGFYRSDFVKGIAYEGPKNLGTAGYSYSFYPDSNFLSFISAVSNGNVVFIHSHGAPGLFTLSPTVSVTGNDIASRNFSSSSKLVYISACQTGLASSTNGNVCSALVNKGVDSVVAFTEEVQASTDTNGIHRFNSIVVYKLINGYSIYAALATAKTQIESETGQFWGADSFTLYGSYSTTIN